MSILEQILSEFIWEIFVGKKINRNLIINKRDFLKEFDFIDI